MHYYNNHIEFSRLESHKTILQNNFRTGEGSTCILRIEIQVSHIVIKKINCATNELLQWLSNCQLTHRNVWTKHYCEMSNDETIRLNQIHVFLRSWRNSTRLLLQNKSNCFQSVESSCHEISYVQLKLKTNSSL